MDFSAKLNKGFTVATPANYRIRVQNILDESCSDELGGMSITVSANGGRAPVTTLVGRLVDQAALLGVLNALYDMRMPLLSVENLDEVHLRTNGK